MRQGDEGSLVFSSLSADQRVRSDHPLRAINRIADSVFAEVAPRLPSEHLGSSIPPEQLLWALLIQHLYTVPSEDLLLEEIAYSVLHRWFVGSWDG
jgi:transposase